MAILSRVADDLFWTGRYIERAIAVTRLINVTAHLELDSGRQREAEVDVWTPLVGTVPGVQLGGAPRHDRVAAVRRHLGFDTSNPNSLASCVESARTAAREVRDSLSSEAWEHINRQYLALREPDLVAEAEDRPHEFFRRLSDSLVLIQGLFDSTLARDECWAFITLGTYLERASNVARVLRIQGHLLDVSDDRRGMVGWLAVLRSCGSLEAYARYYSMRVEPARILEFLLLNPLFPQSLRFSIGAACDALQSVTPPNAGDAARPPERLLGRLRAQIDLGTIDEVVQEGLVRFLGDIEARIAAVSDALTMMYFSKQPQPAHGVAVARAAMILAASQQQ
jgi:uncharacterized alpha-E superfamily protein